jgi:uncharacterized RDD family membrane protein YckC
MTYPPPPNNDPYGQQQPQYGQQPPQYGAPQPPPQYGAPAYGTPGYGAAPMVNYASWIQRVGAYIIDGLVTLPFSILAAIVGRGTDDTTGLPTVNAFYWIFLVLGIAVSGYNRWFQAGKTGQSWGKKALGIRLVGEQTGQPIGAGLAFGRDIAHFVDGIICYIGFLFPLWDAKKQTLADKICKTLVIQ